MNRPGRTGSGGLSIRVRGKIYLEHALAIGAQGFQQHLEDGVRATTLGVHRCLPDEPIPLAFFHQLQTLLILRDPELGKPFHKHPIEFGLMYVQTLGFGGIL